VDQQQWIAAREKKATPEGSRTDDDHFALPMYPCRECGQRESRCQGSYAMEALGRSHVQCFVALCATGDAPPDSRGALARTVHSVVGGQLRLDDASKRVVLLALADGNGLKPGKLAHLYARDCGRKVSTITRIRFPILYTYNIVERFPSLSFRFSLQYLRISLLDQPSSVFAMIASFSSVVRGAILFFVYFVTIFCLFSKATRQKCPGSYLAAPGTSYHHKTAFRIIFIAFGIATVSEAGR